MEVLPHHLQLEVTYAVLLGPRAILITKNVWISEAQNKILFKAEQKVYELSILGVWRSEDIVKISDKCFEL